MRIGVQAPRYRGDFAIRTPSSPPRPAPMKGECRRFWEYRKNSFAHLGGPVCFGFKHPWANTRRASKRHNMG